jgi:hypothetical protein
MGDLVYLYAVLEPASAAAGVPGIDGRPVRLLEEAGLAAAVSEVPAADFEEGPLNERVRDLGWLGPRAVAHQEVNATLHQRHPAVLPLQFGSVFRDEERVRGYLRSNRADLVSRLATVRGRAEYVVAIHRTHEPAEEALLAGSPRLRELQHEIEASSPGRAYLLKQRMADARREAQGELDATVLEEGLTELGTVADSVYAEPVPAEAEDRPLARVSLLVADDSALAGTVEAINEKWAPRGYQLVVTGPWPPYRFGGLEHTATRAAG